MIRSIPTRLGPLALLFFAALLFATAAAAQSGDPFASVHRRLHTAADEALALINEKASPAKIAAAPEPVLSVSAEETISLARLNEARRRLATLGVDAARVFVDEGVPLEYLAVAAVESAFHPDALSPKGARGLWQFMPATAQRFGLCVEEWRDDRLDAQRSTRAAARYLRWLHAQFGDWLLALAAYNAGEGRVLAAIERGQSRDFWRLAALGLLPEETRRYVPAVLAAAGAASSQSQQ
jgi:soluble lytic murein transglycosylase-like protein